MGQRPWSLSAESETQRGSGAEAPDLYEYKADSGRNQAKCSSDTLKMTLTQIIWTDSEWNQSFSVALHD